MEQVPAAELEPLDGLQSESVAVPEQPGAELREARMQLELAMELELKLELEPALRAQPEQAVGAR